MFITLIQWEASLLKVSLKNLRI